MTPSCGPELLTTAGLNPTAARAFVLANTRLLAPPLVPEIALHLAEESLPIWHKVEKELGAINLPPPYWAFAWAGGQALARYVIDHRWRVADHAVLDLGSGSGLVAIAAAKAGAATVCAADVDPFALAAIALNAAANRVSVSAIRQDRLDAPGAPFDLILVGDLFYERQLAERVLRFLEQAAADGADVLVGDPRRSYFPQDRFVLTVEYGVPVTRELEDAEVKCAAVWELANSRSS